MADDKIPTTPAALRREHFCRRYVIHHNASKAYREVYDVEGATAEVNGSRMLRNAKVTARIEELEAEAMRRLEITKDRVERELARIGFASAKDFLNENGTFKAMHELTDDAAAAISSIEVDEIFEGSGKDRVWVGFNKKIKFWNKNGALELIGARFGIGVKKFEIGNPGDFQSNDARVLRKSVTERAARLGVVVKFPKAA